MKLRFVRNGVEDCWYSGTDMTDEGGEAYRKRIRRKVLLMLLILDSRAEGRDGK